MAHSSEVTAGVDVVAAANYNDLRSDVLNVSTGHGHTGSGEDGKQLSSNAFADGSIPVAKLQNRARKTFIPWSGVYWSNNPNNHSAGPIDMMGAQMYKSWDITTAYGYWMVPDDFVSGLSVTFLIVSGGSGDYRFNFRAQGRLVDGVVWSVEWGDTTWTDTATSGILTRVHTLNLTSAAPHHIVSVSATRMGNHAQDTGVLFLRSTGVEVDYTGK